jgi:hypothetical protein
MKILLNPLQKLGKLLETNNVILERIELRLDSTYNANMVNNIQLRQQTNLLKDIKGLLSSQGKLSVASKPDKKEKSIKDRMPSFKGAKDVAIAIGLFAGAVLASAIFFALMPDVSLRSLVTSLAIAGIMTLIVPKFMELTKLYRFKIKNIVKAAAIMPIISMGLLAAAIPLMLMPSVGAGALFTAVIIGIGLGLFIPSFIKLIHATKGIKLKDMLMASGSMAAIAVGIVGVALIFKGLAMVGAFEAPPLLWTLQAGLAILLFAGTFQMIAKTVDEINPSGLVLTGIAMAMIAAGIIGIAYIFQGLSMIKAFEAPPVKWTLTAGLALLIFGGTFVAIANVADKVGLLGLFKAGLAMSFVAMGIVGVAFVFKYLDKVGAFEAPPLDWTLKSGLALLLFAGAFAGLALVADKVGIMGLIKAALALPLAAIGILAVAYVFQYLPEKTTAPDLGWSVDTALSLVIFGIPLVLLGLAALPSGGLALLLGAAGMILIAGTIWVVAKIFANLDPGMEAGARIASASLFAPIDAMTNSLALMKTKIGIENMIPLGKGLLAIAGGWLALSAAMAGKAIGGIVEGIAGGAKKALDFVTGGLTKTDGPFQLLDKLISRKDDLIKIGPAVLSIGRGMASISKAGWNATKALKELNNIAHRKDSVKMASLSIQRIGRSYTEIAKASKMMNVPAIEASTKMFNAIAHVAKMKGQDAMSILAKELMTSVLELSKIVDKLDKNVTKQPDGIKGAMDGVLSGFLDKIKGKTADLKGQAGEAGLIDIAPIVEAIQELEERFMRPIRVQEV